LKNQRTNPSPVYHSLCSGTRPQMGRSSNHLETKPWLGNPTRHHHRKEVNSMPSPI